VVRSALTFAKYAEPWWRWGQCPYIARRLARGHTLGRSYADAMRCYLDRHLLPHFGKKALSAITPAIIETWIMAMREKRTHRGAVLSPTTINTALTCMRIMMREAVRAGHIHTNPAGEIEPLGEKPKARGILTGTEVNRLFDETRIAEVWAGDVRHYSANLLAASTGMRLGEVQALQVQNVHVDRIEVCHAWERGYGLKEPKRGSVRTVPIMATVGKWMRTVLDGSPYQEADDLVYWGKDRHTPMQHAELAHALYAAMNRIGITPEQRRERNVSFHGWRHWFNTTMRARGVPDVKIRAVTGHKTAEMTERYSHLAIEDLGEVRRAQERMISAG
jgi:integrase